MIGQVSVGRVVHYHDVTADRHEPLAAIVTRVWNLEGLVNLTVFDQNGEVREPMTSVQHGTLPGCWSWPPRV